MYVCIIDVYVLLLLKAYKLNDIITYSMQSLSGGYGIHPPAKKIVSSLLI